MILCADDFGISPGVNAAILELAQGKVLNAVSAMTVFRHASSEWYSLAKLHPKIQVGWHVTLTEKDWRTFYRRARRGTLDEGFVKAELRRQWDCFCERFGTTPDFVDGHHHVHQFPGVREALLEFLCERGVRPAVRTSGIPLKGMLKLGVKKTNLILRNAALGIAGREMKRLTSRHSVPTNESLLGSYDPHRDNFAEVYGVYQAISQSPRDLFYCHPGHPDRQLAQRDGFVAKRKEEFSFLKQLIP